MVAVVSFGGGCALNIQIKEEKKSEVDKRNTEERERKREGSGVVVEGSGGLKRQMGSSGASGERRWRREKSRLDHVKPSLNSPH